MTKTLVYHLAGLLLGFLLLLAWWCGYHYGKVYSIREVQHSVKELRDRTEKQSKLKEVRDEEPVLVEVAIPLEYIGVVRCDFDGIYHVQVFGTETITNKDTYRRVVETRDAYLGCIRESLKLEVE